MDTNAQEGLGGMWQSINDNKQLGLYHVIESLHAFCALQDKELVIATTLGSRRTKSKFAQASKAQMKASGEHHSNYKAPESNRALLRSVNYTQSPEKIRERKVLLKKNAKTTSCSLRLVNPDQRCYFNALLQNILTCDPFHGALMDNADDESEPITTLRDILARIEYHTENSLNEWCNLPQIDLLLECFTKRDGGRDTNAQHCPLDFLEWILTSSYQRNTRIQDLFALHRTTQHVYCKGCSTPIKADLNDSINYHCSVAHPSLACTLQQCVDNRYVHM
jgi:hypothetical protein